MSAIPHETTRMGPGQRTIAVPTRRQPRALTARLGSNRPNRLATQSTAGPIVSAAASVTSTPRAAGIPRVWKYGNRVKYRHATAPAMVSPDPMMTCTVPRNMSW